MKIVRASEVSVEEWNRVCDNSSRAWLFHRRSWMALEEKFFGHRGLSFAVVDESGVVGVHPLYVTEVGIGWLERLVHSGIHRHTGFATLDGLPDAVVAEASSLAMRTVMETANVEDADRIQLNSQNLAPINLTAEREELPLWVRDYGFNPGMNFGPNGLIPVPGMATSCADQIVNLGREKPELFGRLAEGCRRAVRKAEKAQVEFEADAGDATLDEYWRLAQAGAARTGEQLAPRAYYEAIVGELGPEGRSHVVFARHQGRRVAAILLAIDKHMVSYLGGVSDPEFLALRVNDFLHWSAISWCKEQGHLHYRLGPAFPEVPQDWPIARVARFKEKFGGRSFTTIQGSWFIKPEKYLAGAIEHLGRLCVPRSPVTPDPE